MANNKLTDERIQELLLKFTRDSYRLNGSETGMALGDAVFALRELREHRIAEGALQRGYTAAEQVSFYLDELNVPKDAGYGPLSLWDRVYQYGEISASERAELQQRRKADEQSLHGIQTSPALDSLPKTDEVLHNKQDGWVKGRFSYDVLFNAIGKAVTIQGAALAISVRAFEEAMQVAAPQQEVKVTVKK